jgi:hypothetical protein
MGIEDRDVASGGSKEFMPDTVKSFSSRCIPLLYDCALFDFLRYVVDNAVVMKGRFDVGFQRFSHVR